VRALLEEMRFVGRVEGRLRERATVWRQHTTDPQVLGLIEEGLRIPFSEAPPRLHDVRNRVAGEGDEAWADEQISAMLESGAIRRWDDLAHELSARGEVFDDKPYCVAPIIVHDKPSSTPECRRRRFIHNLKKLNEYVEDVPCKLESVADFMTS